MSGMNCKSQTPCSANVGKGAPVRVQSTATDWATPQDFFDGLNDEFEFTLDVCASRENAKCDRYFTKDDDGLKQKWEGVCWMNPPYGKEIPKWMEKAYKSSLDGATVVCLVPARTDTRWWHSFAEKGEKRFVKGRLKFLNCSGQTLRNETPSVKDGRHAPNTGAPFPSAVIIFRPNAQISGGTPSAESDCYANNKEITMTGHEMTREVREELCRKLRAVVSERGQASLKGAVMVGMYDAENVSDIPYITCPTISVDTLGNVDHKTAREFENA